MENRDEARARMLTVLRSNKGFANPDDWIDYGLRHSFKRVRAESLDECPDCQARSRSTVGQYVYYSTLITLQTCQVCGLLYADKGIDPAVLRRHFEVAYKNEEYFRNRRWIFERIATLIDQHAPLEARVLDLGGAKGHLMVAARRRRSDLKITVQDISDAACSWASAVHGFNTICGKAVEIEEQQHEKYDVIVLSDVIYYEPELNRLWTMLPRLLTVRGLVVLRVPNKLVLIRCAQWLRYLRRHGREMQDAVAFFNPEHLYVFSRAYLEARLGSLGLIDVRVLPSPLLATRWNRAGAHAFYHFARTVHAASLGKVVITPSFLITARKAGPLGTSPA